VTLRQQLAGDFGRFLGRVPVIVAAVGSVAFAAAALALLRSRDFGRVDVLDLSARGLGAAAVAAVAFAVITIVADRTMGFPDDINVPWPRALVVYPVMAIIAEAIFHIAPAAVLVLVFELSVDGDLTATVLSCLAAVALLESAYQVRAGLVAGMRTNLLLFVAVHLTVLGLAQLLLLWGFGVAAMVVFRLVYYAAWHVVWGWLRLATDA
jgi:hypothetical protein